MIVIQTVCGIIGGVIAAIYAVCRSNREWEQGLLFAAQCRHPKAIAGELYYIVHEDEYRRNNKDLDAANLRLATLRDAIGSLAKEAEDSRADETGEQ